MGAAGGRAPRRGGGRVRDALQLELGVGGDHGQRADALLASVRGAEDEQGVPGGGVWGRTVGVEVVGWQQGMVKADEVEAKVRLVFESEEGERLRARVASLKEAAAMAWKEGGWSRAVFGKFLLDMANLGAGKGRA